MIFRNGDQMHERFSLTTRTATPVTERQSRIDKNGKARTLLHVATEWLGHFPTGPAIAALRPSHLS
jgi:hypothetical protein